MLNMMSPGVYVQEADYSEYVVDSSSCIVGMVGAARRGPVGVPTLITTQEQMIKTFGEPIEGEYGVYSALQALSHANQLYYVRVVRGGIAASAGIRGTDKILYRAKSVGESSNGMKVFQTEPDTEGLFTVTVFDKNDKLLEDFPGCTLDNTQKNFVEVIVNSKSDYVIADVQYNGTFKEGMFTLGEQEGTEGVGTGRVARAGEEGVDKITFKSKYFESDLNGCSLIISEPDQFGFFNLVIRDKESMDIESWANLSTDPKSTRFAESVINSNSDRITCVVDPDEDIKIRESTLVFYGGDSAIEGITAIDMIGETKGTGLYAFSNPEIITIDVLLAPGWSDAAVINAGLHLCETRADCLYVADPPFGMTAQQVVTWSNGTGSWEHTGFDTSYGALYWPWLKVSDTFTAKNIWLPPSGFVVAQYAYNDEVGYPWMAPAGLNRGRITKAIGVEVSPTQGERDHLYGNRNIVNPIVNFVSNGIVIWGQKTMQRQPTALDRVNVRRLMNYLKKNIGNMTRSFVFEQNASATWERWRGAVEPILLNVKRNDGLYEYKIVTQASASDIENNRMPINIYVKPTKTAEFISLTFNIMPYSASFDNL